MKGFFSFLSMFAIVFSVNIAYAGGALALKDKLDPIKQLSGVFTQKITDKDAALIQQSSGEFKVKRPGFFHWRTSEPYEQVVVGTPEKVWVYDPDLEQVTVDQQSADQANNPMALLTDGAGDIESRYDVSTVSDVETTRFKLVPKQSNPNFTEIEFVFSKDALNAITFKDKLMQQTEIILSQSNKKDVIDDAVFVFDVPPGTDIIQND